MKYYMTEQELKQANAWFQMLEAYDPGGRRFSELPDMIRAAYHDWTNEQQVKELNRAVLAGKETS